MPAAFRDPPPAQAQFSPFLQPMVGLIFASSAGFLCLKNEKKPLLAGFTPEEACDADREEEKPPEPWECPEPPPEPPCEEPELEEPEPA